MIRYPLLKKGATIGVTAPSSGLDKPLHSLAIQAFERLEQRGYKVVSGNTVWTQNKARSAPALERATELSNMLHDEEMDLIIPPWGGELLIEIVEHLDFQRLPEKWILGYSDVSVLLLAITLKTGIATAHGTNLIDMRGEYQDDTSAKWESVLATNQGDSIEQYSSQKYQKKWDHDNPTPCVFHLTEETYWKSVGVNYAKMEGRLLGGCIDVIKHLIGTPFGDVPTFQKNRIQNEPILWYFENCEMNVADLRRTFVQMKLAGWFQNCSGILFGRSPANDSVGNYTIEDVYQELAHELNIPIIYDIDCGHVPPQITFINGAYGEVTVEDGKGKVLQKFI
ncbi:S66 family peptidase [Salirhabdus sp. Marseille-P4669]|uniref:S66 family peptidase n=1 Tax=Salirhabdus sp. Marseille-P4669 TaxID=2042310 RepID=UPI000C7B0300|nr:S66 peptidase family protein [Salirhabdus sp. Marseille-P4669]